MTQHGKQDLVRAPLEAALRCRLVHTSAYDTDKLGTFTREVDRQGSQLDAARAKARIGMTLTGAHLGLASEGAFGPDPFGGLMPWNTELLLWVDQDLGIEVSGIAHGPAHNAQRAVQTVNELKAFATEAGFPSHHLVVRPASNDQRADHPEMRKGLQDMEALIEAFHWAQAHASQQTVFVENDLRAFANPTRQAIIWQAAQNLIPKLQSLCPHCHSPGFWIAQHTPGLPCKSCLQPTRLPIAEVWRCPKCAHETHQPSSAGQWADPSRCPYCNP